MKNRRWTLLERLLYRLTGLGPMASRQAWREIVAGMRGSI